MSGAIRNRLEGVSRDPVDPRAQHFGGVAAEYEQGRPGYPEEAVAFIAAELGIGPGCVVVDLGAGTGKFTRMLVATGATVIAVEPIAEMRAELSRALPGVVVHDAVVSDLPLADASADVVTAAQAFHWFSDDDDLAEIARVLRPGGGVGLLWNRQDLDVGMWERIEPIIAPHRPPPRTAWRAALEAAPWSGPLREKSFVHRHATTPEQLSGRVASLSWIAGLDDAVRSDVVRHVAAAASELAVDGVLDVVERTEVVLTTRH